MLLTIRIDDRVSKNEYTLKFLRQNHNYIFIILSCNQVILSSNNNKLSKSNKCDRNENYYKKLHP